MQSADIGPEMDEIVSEGVGEVAGSGVAACDVEGVGDADGLGVEGSFVETAETFHTSFFPFFAQTRFCPALLEAFEPTALQRAPGLLTTAAETPVICTKSPTMATVTIG